MKNFNLSSFVLVVVVVLMSLNDSQIEICGKVEGKSIIPKAQRQDIEKTADSHILVIGIFNILSWDPSQDGSSFREVGTLSTFRFGTWAGTIASGEVVIAGTAPGLAPGASKKTEIYNNQNHEVNAGPDLNQGRYDHAGAVIGDAAFVCGGKGRFGAGIASCEKFENNQWTTIRELPEGRASATGFASGTNLYMCGGINGLNQLHTLHRLDTSAGNNAAWEPVTAPEVSRFAAAAAPLTINGREVIVLCGGLPSTSQPILEGSCEQYDPQADSWSPLGASLVNPRALHDLVAWNNKLYAIGGATGFRPDPQNPNGPLQPIWTDTIEVYDPEVGQWVQARTKLPSHEAPVAATVV